MDTFNASHIQRFHSKSLFVVFLSLSLSLSLSPQRAVPEVSELVRQQLRKIQSSFPDILSQFMEPSSTSAPPLAVPPPMVTTAPVTTPAKGQERGSAGCSGVEERETATPTDRSASL